MVTIRLLGDALTSALRVLGHVHCLKAAKKSVSSSERERDGEPVREVSVVHHEHLHADCLLPGGLAREKGVGAAAAAYDWSIRVTRPKDWPLIGGYSHLSRRVQDGNTERLRLSSSRGKVTGTTVFSGIQAAGVAMRLI